MSRIGGAGLSSADSSGRQARLKEKRYVYKRKSSRDYIEHLEEEWYPLNKDAVDLITKHYKRPWDRTKEHATEFS